MGNESKQILRSRFLCHGISLFFLLSSAGCATKEKQVIKHANNNGEAVKNLVPRMRGFQLKHYQGPRVAYFLRAQRADFLDQEGKAVVFLPHLAVYDQIKSQASQMQKEKKILVVDGALKIEATGDRGEVNLNTKDIMLEGHVVYKVASKGYTLTTSKLYYWASRKETQVPDGTGYQLSTPNGTAEGSGMIAREELD